MIKQTNGSVSSPDTSSKKWLAGTLIFVFFRAFPNLRYIIGRDQATYCVIGQGLLHGKLLYRDLWDNKPPGIFYVYALIVKAFGPVMWSVGVVDIAWLLVISCCLFYLVRRYLGNPGAALAVVFYACRHCRQGYIHAVQPEAFLLLGVFGAWFLLIGRQPSPPHIPSVTVTQGTRARFVARYLGVGLLLGMTFWMKYNAVAFFPFLVLLPFLDFRELDRGLSHVRLMMRWRDWLLRMASLSAGFAFAVVAVLAYFLIAGAWPAMKEIQFEVLPRYGAMAFHWSFYYIYWALWQTQNHLGIWWEVMPALALLIAWWQREVGRIAPLTLLALAGYLCTAMQGRFHPYYFETTYPFFAVFWAYVGLKTYEGFMYVQGTFAQRHWSIARALVWVVFALLICSVLPEESVRTAEQYRFAADWWRDPEGSYKTYYWQLPLEKIGDEMRVVDYLKSHSQSQDEVYVWGTAPLINFLAQRENPSRFVSNLGLQSAWVPEKWRQELVRTLESARPRYIVVERNDMVPTLTFSYDDSEQYLRKYPGLGGLLRAQYAPADNYQDFEIYERKTPKSD